MPIITYRDIYLLALCSLPQLVDKLSDGHEHRQHQAGRQNNKNPAQVLDPHGARFTALFIQAAAAAPPLFFQHVEPPILQDAEDGDADFVPVRRSWKQRKESISLGETPAGFCDSDILSNSQKKTHHMLHLTLECSIFQNNSI